MRELCSLHHENNSISHQAMILSLTEWKEAQMILLYAPLLGEVDLMPLLLESHKQHFLFPRIEGSNLGIYQWAPKLNWITGRFGIKEPDPASWKQVSLAEVDLALIPGMAFDLSGARLGRGRGFYDRLLGEAEFRGMKIGLCWKWQIVPSIPCEPHDAMMDRIISY